MDKLWYHGSDKNFTQFDYSKLGKNFKINNLIGFYLTNNLDVAMEYGKYIYTVIVFKQDLKRDIVEMSVDDYLNFLKSFGKRKYNEFLKDLGYNEEDDEEQMIFDLLVWEKDIEILAKIYSYINVNPKLFLTKLVESGFTHHIIENDKRDGDTTLLVFEPPHIKTVDKF